MVPFTSRGSLKTTIFVKKIKKSEVLSSASFYDAKWRDFRPIYHLNIPLNIIFVLMKYVAQGGEKLLELVHCIGPFLTLYQLITDLI